MQTLRSRVITAADAKADPKAEESSYLAKVVRYIPGEIVAAYLVAYNALAAAPNVPLETILWIVVGVLTLVTPFWILFATADPAKPRPYYQAVAAMVSFVIWAFAMQSWYQPVYGFLMLILGTFLMPILEKVFVRTPRGS
jgi:FtsH-binding integral membrane protein